LLNGLSFALNLDTSQKTGMFLDQRVNCRTLDSLAPGARVLDGHCYAGLWSCHAARAGATEVLGVDTSAPAIEAARGNAERNGFTGQCRFECTDIRIALNRGERYDVVILDPPALAKSRAQATRALGLYQALNRDAMNCVEPGGYLITSSCSHFVDTPAFVEMLKRAAAAVHREVWTLEVRGAAPDHPVLMSMPETSYLCCAVLRIL
jgi:23S rRNA (cytosine1962-C5)-methyltransferase